MAPHECQRCRHCGLEIEYVAEWAANGYAPWRHTSTGNSMCYLVGAPEAPSDDEAFMAAVGRVLERRISEICEAAKKPGPARHRLITRDEIEAEIRRG